MERLIRSRFVAIGLLVTIAAGAEAGEAIASGADAPIRQMAITVDDLPASRSHALTLAQQEYITRRVVGILSRHGVPAVGFVNESKLEVDGRVDPARVALLERWLDSDMELGNHGYAHLDLHGVGGIYAREYAEALGRGDEAGARRLGEDYLRYMLDVVAFYEQQAREILGRPLPHVLLIHANRLNAEWLDELLQRLEVIGYAWVPLEQALEDPAYARPIGGYAGAGGITWLHRWALTQGVDRAVFQGEPRVPGWVEQEAAVQEQLSIEE